MASYNSITIIGNVGKEPEFRSFDNDKSRKVTFNVAVDKYDGKDQGGKAKYTSKWFTVEGWDRLAENAERNLQKGTNVMVVGIMDYHEFEKKDGSRGTAWYISAERIITLSRAKSTEGGQMVSQEEKAQQTQDFGKITEKNPAVAPLGGLFDGKSDETSEDELPF